MVRVICRYGKNIPYCSSIDYHSIDCIRYISPLVLFLTCKSVSLTLFRRIYL